MVTFKLLVIALLVPEVMLGVDGAESKGDL